MEQHSSTNDASYMSFQDIVIKYQLLMTNGDDFFHKHFSADEFCKYYLKS